MRPLTLCFLALSAIQTTPAAAQVDTWLLTPLALDINAADGDTGTVECPPRDTFIPGPLIGTGTYTVSSTICYAGLHFGWLTADAGAVLTYRLVDWPGPFEASTQNGLTSTGWENGELAFQITAAAAYVPPAPPTVPDGIDASAITWADTPETLFVALLEGEDFAYYCPPTADRSLSTPAIGSDLYAGRSGICNAAAHRGLLTAETGGAVSILILGEQPRFVGSNRNGIRSGNEGIWSSGFVFIPETEE